MEPCSLDVLLSFPPKHQPSLSPPLFLPPHQMVQSCPSLQDDALILRYAAKALAPPSPSEPPPKPPNPSQPPLSASSSSTPGDRSRYPPPEFARSSTLAIPRAGGEPPRGSALRSSSTASGLRGVLTGSEGPSMPRRISWAAGTSTMWAAASQFTRGLLHQGEDWQSDWLGAGQKELHISHTRPVSSHRNRAQTKLTTFQK